MVKKKIVKKKIVKKKTIKRKETRGRKKLSEKQTTKKLGFCLPEKYYKELVRLGKTSGNGYGFHVREILIEALKKSK